MSSGNAEASSSSSSSPPSSSSSSESSRTSRVATKLSTKLRDLNIPPHLHSMTAGAGAGLVASVTTCPLDVIKTRLQAQHVSKEAGYEGVGLTVARIWRQSGVRGFYRGLGPTLGGYLPTWGIYFTVYDLVKDRLGSWKNSGGKPPSKFHARCRSRRESLINTDRPSECEYHTRTPHSGHDGRCDRNSHDQPPMGRQDPLHGESRLPSLSLVTSSPLTVQSTQAQAVLPPSDARYRNTLDAFTSIYRTEGFRAFYKGLLPSLMGVTHVAVQFPLYEAFKNWAGKFQTPRSQLQLGRNENTADNGVDVGGSHASLPIPTILACSAGSKMIASLATYPHEVLRTRLQIAKAISSSTSTPRPTPAPSQLYSPLVTGSNPPPPLPLAQQLSTIASDPSRLFAKRRKGGIIDTAIKIKRQDGWRGFYRGLSINLVRTVPNSAVTMLS